MEVYFSSRTPFSVADDEFIVREEDGFCFSVDLLVDQKQAREVRVFLLILHHMLLASGDYPERHITNEEEVVDDIPYLWRKGCEFCHRVRVGKCDGAFSLVQAAA